MGPFQVTKEMVAGLGDEQLRMLLDRLLGAEAKRRGIPLSCISVGGNQTAGDGGVDASIAWAPPPEPLGWFPRQTVRFQCKAETMAAAALTKEMRPKGKVRLLFAELAKERGAYIVFSTDDPAKAGHDKRIASMRAAINDVPDGEHIELDFYGADKIARWTNEHPGVSLWVLEQSGRTLGGWRPFGSWSSPEAAGQPYIFDDRARTITGGQEVDVQTAITAMRQELANPGGVVRLVGISGMGKTRLAEALFDEAIDPSTAISPSRAIYGDTGGELAIGAALLAEQIVHDAVEAVVVVDNCKPRTHSQLAEIVRRSPSQASLLTIDYDIGGEDPIGELISLGEASEALLSLLLKQRFPNLSEAERHHLANFSGGNTRIALKIAQAGGEGVDLSKLKDSELLERLFQTGRQETSPLDRRCAEAASLVYAFYVTEGDGHAAEHPILAELAGVSTDDFYRAIATFLEWGITQQRGPQRAVMPPPLANMLAAPFIRRSDPTSLLDKFISAGPRLLASFARRLGQLHAEPVAVEIARRLFARGAPFDRPGTLTETLRRGFIKAAPAVPEAALAAIERQLASDGRAALIDPAAEGRVDYLRLLVHIAHDPLLFRRAVEALLPFALAVEKGEDQDSAAEHLLDRFSPVLSLTLAPQEARLSMIDRLLADDDERTRRVGVEALDRMLKAANFGTSLDMEFGARPRVTEWRPNQGAGYQPWFRAAYDRAIEVANAGRPESDRARSIIAKHFREHLDSIFPPLAAMAMDAMRRVRRSGYWDRGWRAANDALHFHQRRPGHGDLSNLEALERDLRPRSLDECFEAFVLGEPWRHWHPSGRRNSPIRNVGMLARSVGRTLGASGGDVLPYVERAAGTAGQNSVAHFMSGLAMSVSDLDGLWTRAYSLFGASPPGARSPRLLAGILESAGRRDREWVEARLDDAVTDPLLVDHLVILNSAVPLDENAIERFRQALASGAAKPDQFALLQNGGVTKPVPASALALFLEDLFSHESGVLPALQILHMRYYGDASDKIPYDEALLALGRKFVTDPRTYSEDLGRHDHGVAEIAQVAMRGPKGEDTAVEICRALVVSERRRHVYRDFDELCTILITTYPRVVLDEVVALEDSTEVLGRFFGGWTRDDDDHDQATLKIDADQVLEWAREDPQERAVRLASVVSYYMRDPEAPEFRWSPLALGLIEMAPDPIPVLDIFEHRFAVGSGSGAWSLRLVRRRPLLVALADHTDHRIRGWVMEAQQRLEERIVYWDKIDRSEDSRFE